MISNCIFTWAITRVNFDDYANLELWIDFKLYFYVSNHKEGYTDVIAMHVVNWFQIVFLREQSQGFWRSLYTRRSCELISNCIFTWAITSEASQFMITKKLWIDFKLYFYVSNHKMLVLQVIVYLVVNWFQIVFLREQSQEWLVSIASY